MKKLIVILLSIIMVMSVALAEVASPTLPVMKPTDIRNDKGEVVPPTFTVTVVEKEEVKKETSAAVEVVREKATEITNIISTILPSIPSVPALPGAPAAPVVPDIGTEEIPGAEEIPAMTVEEVQQKVEEAYVQVFGEKAVEELKEVMQIIPEASVGSLTIDEVAPLQIHGYEEEFGDVHVVFESVTQYKDTDKLVAMIGIIEEDAENAGAEVMINWIPLNAGVEEGKVVITFTQEAMKMANGKENVVALMRAQDMNQNM